MFKKSCPFCHQKIPFWTYEAHIAKHTARRPDGQMEDHISLEPAERYEGSLEGVPQWYRHLNCGGVTGMPEKIIRSYLANPFLYNGTTFCGRCGDYRPHREYIWTETGENMEEYFATLQREHKEKQAK